MPTLHRDSTSRFYVPAGNLGLIGKDWTEAASHHTCGFAWLQSWI